MIYQPNSRFSSFELHREFVNQYYTEVMEWFFDLIGMVIMDWWYAQNGDELS